MYRTRDYRRDVRNRKIAHRRKLVKSFFGHDWYLNGSYSGHDTLPGELWSDYLNRMNACCKGMYSKGKIHCSCWMCTYNKKYKLPRFSDLKDKAAVKDALSDYYNS